MKDKNNGCLKCKKGMWIQFEKNSALVSEKFQQDKKTSYILEIKIKDEVKGNESMKKNGGGKIKKKEN